MSDRKEEAWGRFWRSGGTGAAAGCLPNALGGVGAAQQEVWREFVRPLRKGARVLDLATGDGAVLVRMRAARPDLKLTGVDSSPVLPRPPKGIALRTGVAMERLPFGDASFDAVSSQFGLEYGDTAQIAAEIARVLKPGGRFAAIVHDADGPIVAHNAPRRDALGWAIDSWLDKARSLVAARRVAAIETPRQFAEAPAEARRRFSGQPVAEEIATAILRTLELGRSRPPAESLDVLGTIEARARGEIGRIDQLCAAARNADGICRIDDQLRAAGLDGEPPAHLREQPEARPFAWLVRGHKPG